MDYEKKYKEALEKIREGIQPLPDGAKISGVTRAFLEEVFPELRESEGETIRKEIIEFVDINTLSVDERHDRWIAWLEKQGQTFTKKDVDDAYLKGISDAKNELEKQGKQDARYRCLEELLAADDIYQMSVNDTMTNEAKEKAAKALSKLCIGKLLGFEKQGEKVEPIEGFNTEFERQISQLIASIINKEHEYTEAFVKWTSDALLNYAKHEIDKQGEHQQLYIRFGDIPANEKSKIYRGEKETGTENGVSVYPAFKHNGNIVLGLSLPITKTTLHTQQHLLEYDNRPCYLVKGDYIGNGADGEPLIRNVEIVEEIKDFRVKEGEARYEVKAGNSLSVNAFDYEYATITQKDFAPKDYHDIDPHFGISVEDLMSKKNPADKVEPKFKVGDWVVWKNKCYKVNYNGFGYELVDQNGLSTSLEYGTVDENAHLWDITKDANDGDVLISQYGNPLIYNGNYNSLYIGAYCGITCDDNKFKVAEEKCHWTENVDIKPATKEQRDTLMKAMADAGYTFDFEKKELKKIEQKKDIYNKLTDFESSLKHIMEEAIECGDTHNLKADADMLLRLVQKPAEWSEEDEKILSDIIKDLVHPWNEYIPDRIENEIKWLKNKLKSLRPQKQWKPTEEQITVINDTIRFIENKSDSLSSDYLYNKMKELLKQLKAL